MNIGRVEPNVKRKSQSGFILTLELMILMTVLGIGLLIGFISVRDAVFKYYIVEQSKEIFVSDANDVNLGRSIGFDEHEAPLLVFVDRSQTENFRSLLGVRDDRFTSREPVYYTLPNCQGDPCMKLPSDEDADSQGIDFLPNTGSVSYLYALQGGPTYGVGAGNDNRVKGALYRSGAQSCPVDLLASPIGSRWMSQKVVSGEPCEAFVLPIAIATTTPDPACLLGAVVVPNGNGNGNGNGTTTAALDCCPEGSELRGSGLNALCIAEEVLVLAESVPNPNIPTTNVLDGLVAPFSVNLPMDNDPDTWIYTPPRSENGS